MAKHQTTIKRAVSCLTLVLTASLSGNSQSLDTQALQQAKTFFSSMYRRCGEYYYYQIRERRFRLYQCKYAPTVTISGKVLQARRLSEADRLNGVDPLPVAWEGLARINLGVCRSQDFFNRVELGPAAWGAWEDNSNDAINFKNAKGKWDFYNEPTGGEMFTKKVIEPISCGDVPNANRLSPVNLPSWGKRNGDRNNDQSTLLAIPANYGGWFYLGRGPMEIFPDNPYSQIYIDGTGHTYNMEGGGSNSQALAPDALLGSIIAKLGREGRPFQLFKPRVFLAGGYKIKSEDEVYVAINDSYFGDNRGVHVISVSGKNLCFDCPEKNPKPVVTSSRRDPISGGVLNGKALNLRQPDYPNIAKSAHVAGQVTVQILVDESGNVISASAVSGHPLLQPAAVAAARQVKFEPTKLSGGPVKVNGVLIYSFGPQ